LKKVNKNAGLCHAVIKPEKADSYDLLHRIEGELEEHCMAAYLISLLAQKKPPQSTMVPDFPRNCFFSGIQKTIRIYAFIRYYQLYGVMQPELDYVKGEDLCVH
jgi:hypothetical protein